MSPVKAATGRYLVVFLRGVNVGGNKTLLLLDHFGAEHVLKNSPEIYASDPDAKRRGMSHFQPDSLTISTGDKWRDRRRFNEAVLHGAMNGGGHSAKALEVVRREARPTRRPSPASPL